MMLIHIGRQLKDLGIQGQCRGFRGRQMTDLGIQGQTNEF